MSFNKSTFIIFFICAIVLNFGLQHQSYACSRVLHMSKDSSHVVTGRSMDWFEDTDSDLWLFPRGMKKEGAAGKNSAHWVSKYGSVVTASFNASTVDGLNEKGLMVNLLYLGETDFGKRNEDRPGLSWAVYPQYILDNFSSVADAVEGMKDDYLQLVASPIPGSSSKPPTIHFSFSDPTGDSAIFEYLKGKLVIHHGKQYTVMTNSPIYDQQLALNAYWTTIGGEAMLPGTRRAADRYVRASYYSKQLPEPKTDRQAVANIMSVMCNVSVPFGASDPQHPNLSSTIWRTAADNVNKIYYFDSTLSPNIIWVQLKRLDFSPNAPVKKLNLVGNYDLVGDVSKNFIEAKPFVFTGPMKQ